jgi:hypothetical protein
MPHKSAYSSYFQLDLNLRYLLKIAFIKINIFIYDINIEFKSKQSSDVKIIIYSYPIMKNIDPKSIENIRLKLIN